MAPELKLLISQYFTGCLTYQDADRFRDIKAKFTKLELIDAIKASPFRHFWKARKLTFSGTLVHSFLLRKMKVDNEKEDERCEVRDDAYKLGLIAFIEGVLVSKEGNVQVWPDILKFVNDLEFFFKYPWSERAFRKLMQTLNKDMQHYKDNIDKKKGKKVAQEETLLVAIYLSLSTGHMKP
uniref:DUF1985 domain-containing protein n=1 Tax=Cannabis sativa TaxID=3483 RepID=A0A803Q8E6_CANSA